MMAMNLTARLAREMARDSTTRLGAATTAGVDRLRRRVW